MDYSINYNSLYLRISNYNVDIVFYIWNTLYMANYENKRGVPLTKDDLLNIKPNPWIEAVIAVAGPVWDAQKNHLQKNGYLQIDDEIKLPDFSDIEGL